MIVLPDIVKLTHKTHYIQFRNYNVKEQGYINGCIN